MSVYDLIFLACPPPPLYRHKDLSTLCITWRRVIQQSPGFLSQFRQHPHSQSPMTRHGLSAHTTAHRHTTCWLTWSPCAMDGVVRQTEKREKNARFLYGGQSIDRVCAQKQEHTHRIDSDTYRAEEGAERAENSALANPHDNQRGLKDRVLSLHRKSDRAKKHCTVYVADFSAIKIQYHTTNYKPSKCTQYGGTVFAEKSARVLGASCPHYNYPHCYVVLCNRSHDSLCTAKTTQKCDPVCTV